jgi:hypothetical protein
MAMARNRIQFQMVRLVAKYRVLYCAEDHCWERVVAWRRLKGFPRPGNVGMAHCIVEADSGRHRSPWTLRQCNAYRKQTAQATDTIFHSTKLPLDMWFQAIYRFAQTKRSAFSISPGRRSRVTQTTVWKIKIKLTELMLTRPVNAGQSLSCQDVQMATEDAAYRLRNELDAAFSAAAGSGR